MKKKNYSDYTFGPCYMWLYNQWRESTLLSLLSFNKYVEKLFFLCFNFFHTVFHISLDSLPMIKRSLKHPPVFSRIKAPSSTSTGAKLSEFSCLINSASQDKTLGTWLYFCHHRWSLLVPFWLLIRINVLSLAFSLHAAFLHLSNSGANVNQTWNFLWSSCYMMREIFTIKFLSIRC